MHAIEADNESAHILFLVIIPVPSNRPIITDYVARTNGLFVTKVVCDSEKSLTSTENVTAATLAANRKK